VKLYGEGLTGQCITRRKDEPEVPQLNSADQLCSSQPVVWWGCLLWLLLSHGCPFHSLKKFSIMSQMSIII